MKNYNFLDAARHRRLHVLIKEFDYYEDLSMCYCQFCGMPAEYITKGWIGYFCKECAEKNFPKASYRRLTEEDIPRRWKGDDEYSTGVDFKNFWGLNED